MVEDKYTAFLIEQLRTDKVGHSGRNLYTHLKGTHDLLENWDNRQAVCLGGLFHSIYGTWHFRHTSCPIDRRNAVRDLIGEEAEFLAYVFCVAERPKEFIENIQSRDVLVTDHYLKKKIILSRPQLVDLLEIETANLIEQGGNISGLLRSLRGSGVSEGAKAAIAAHLVAHQRSAGAGR
jgi:Domain of unknown function (DUF6817)